MTTAALPQAPLTKLPPMVRVLPLEFTLQRAEGEAAQGADADRFRVCISSDTPVERWFGREILDHNEKSVDLSRAKLGLALRVVDQLDGTHRVGEQVGVVEDFELKGSKLFGSARFGRSARAQEVKQDVVDGIRKFVSVGYRVARMELEESDAKKGDTYRCTRWMPYEVSVVSVPADATAQFARSAEGDEQQVEVIVRTQREDRSMDSPSTPGSANAPTPPAAAAPAAPVVTQDRGPSERQRSVAITQLVKTHRARLASMGVDVDAKAEGWLNSDSTVDQVRGQLLDLLSASPATPGVRPPDASRSVDLTPKEQKEYSLCRAILAVADKNRSAAPFEYEVHDAIADRIGESERGGIYVPLSLATDPLAAQVRERILEQLPPAVKQYFERAALDVQTATKGAELKFIEPGPFIELLRNRMMVRAMGARILTGLQGDVAFPRQTGAASLFWVPESPTADVTSSNLLLNQLSLAPKIAQATTSYSRKLLAQAVRDIDSLVREDLALVNALGLDLAAINGSGTLTPTGILNTSGIGSVTLGANGGVPTYDAAVDLETALAAANADQGSLGYLTTPQVRGRYKKVAQISATTGIPAWFQGELNGYRAEATNQVPSNLTKGTSTTICHAVIFGNWAEVIMAMWGELEIIADPYSKKNRGDIELTTFIMADVGLRHAASMAAIKDALP